MGGPVPWRVAWQKALYGQAGFYRQAAGPAGHFTTATHGVAGQLLADGLWGWADRLGLDGIVDLGAGRGELLRRLHAAAPGRPLTGLDVVPRPVDLPGGIDWVVSPGGAGLPPGWQARRALVVAHEWLDVVPCTIGQVAGDGSVREVLVDALSGEESLGDTLGDPDLLWCQRFWPSVVGAGAQPGDRVEIGRQRDEAWDTLVGRVDDGGALAVDYGHTAGERPRAGTLAAYRLGRPVEPVPDGSRDVTAHVAVDSLRQTRRLTQREALASAAAPFPEHDLARRDPAAYLHSLARQSEAGRLRRRGGFGDYWWVLALV